MAGFILGKKTEQSQMFNEKGERIPTTFIYTNPCILLDVNWSNTKGYMSVKLGFGKCKQINKPTIGQLEKAGVKTPLHFLREIRLERMKDMVKSVEENGKKGIALGETKIFIGDTIQPNLVFKKGDFIDVAGISKGKGFQGVVKRHRFAGGPKTHGQSDRHRAPGSMGQTTTPGRVYKGKRMAGRMGTERVTIQNLEVIEVREDGIKVKGLIPGHKESLIEVRTSII